MATSAQVIGASILFAVYVVFVLYFVIKGARGTKNIKDYAVGSFTFFAGLRSVVIGRCHDKCCHFCDKSRIDSHMA